MREPADHWRRVLIRAVNLVVADHGSQENNFHQPRCTVTWAYSTTRVSVHPAPQETLHVGGVVEAPELSVQV
jgi:hypothetical protein